MLIDEILTEEERLELDLMSLEMETAVSVDTYLDDFAPVYRDNLNNMSRVQILYGGSSSGKSVSKAQQAVLEVLIGGRNWVVCRKIGKDSRHSTFVEVNKVIDSWGLHGRFRINKTDLTITCDNGYVILFKGLDDLEKLKSITVIKGAVTDIWIEEATQSQSDDIKQLLRRQRGGDVDVPKRLHMTFNPIFQQSWIYQEYFVPIGWTDDQIEYNDDNGRLTIQKTTYKDNPFLAQDEIDTLEDETDKYWYEVYTLGNWGVLGNVIFTNYEIRDLSGMVNQFDRPNHGVDWGFGVDPFAFNSTHYDKARRTLYIFNEIHTGEASDEMTAEMIRPFVGNRRVICDSAEPKAIAKYKELGIKAVGAQKGQGSVETGYRWLRGINIVIDKWCVHTIQEFQIHSWKEDRYGDPLPVPEDKNNHHIDDIRYQCEDYMLESNQAKIQHGGAKLYGSRGQSRNGRTRGRR